MILLEPTRHLVCPNCTLEMQTRETKTIFHPCKGLKGLNAPMTPAGVKVDVRTVERGDYIGTDRVQLHEGRPVMAVITERPDGEDRAVFAPAATGGAR